MPKDEGSGRFRICLGGVIEEEGELEIEEILTAFGPIKHLWFNKDPRGANVFFEDDDDAMEAVRCLDWTLVSLFSVK